MEEQETKYRTITLSNRPPVRINEAEWRLLAEAVKDRYEGEFKSQSSRTTDGWVRVRKHSDGRALVYGGHDYSTRWQGEKGATYRAGLLLPAPTTAEDIAKAIREVCHDLGERSGADEWWREIAAQCIADMPPTAI